ncbi:MAG: transglycosylase domain-containing protein [Gammaproteobacteria bacterium]|jgi:penicillin-binding protein 1A
MNTWLRNSLRILTFAAAAGVSVFALLTGAYFYVEPSLPDAAELRDVQFQIPMSIYSRDGRLMQQYGEQKRTPVPYEEIPEVVKQAFLAAEDDRFFEHSGIDYAGILRGAVYFVTRPGERVPGGSTITQQVSRTANLMSRDYSLVRKFKEAILAFRIENEFSKEEILGLFLNTTFFGQRANGIASAAQTYFNKDIDQLSLGEVAIIAGIPQGPSIMNPYNSPENAAARRAYVLRRMLELGYINAADRNAALAEPIVSQKFGLETELSADYIAQMAYEWAVARFGKEMADSAGLNVITSVDSRLQVAANDALRAALESYDRNHGYRGPLANIDLSAIASAEDSADPDATGFTTALDDLLADYPEQFGSEAGVVVAVNDIFADVYLRSAGLVNLGVDSFSWARSYINDDRQGPRPEVVSDVVAAGDVVRFRRLADGRLELFQIPEVEGALVSIDPMDGAVVALVGGYSFQRNAFNRVTQAGRQPGSSFKPFFYLSALANGYTLARIVNDAPYVEHSETLETTRAVVNYGGEYHGEIPLRFALFESLNAAADRVVRDILPRNSIRYLERFGFGPDALPNNASLALGSGSVTPMELAGAYSILANGGYSVGIRAQGDSVARPYFIDRVEDSDGNVLYDASLSVEMLCRESTASSRSTDGWSDATSALIERPSDIFPPLRCAERVESPQRIYLITDVMKDIVRSGSGRRAGQAFAGRRDLAGKTGTTTGPRDAWFAGFNADIVAVVRVGFDVDTRDLGQGEQGGRTAIPAWIDFMRAALDGMPEHELPRPPGIVERRIDPETGLIAADCNRNAHWEMFLLENQPEREPNTACLSNDPLPTATDEVQSTVPLFQ